MKSHLIPVLVAIVMCMIAWDTWAHDVTARTEHPKRVLRVTFKVNFITPDGKVNYSVTFSQQPGNNWGDCMEESIRLNLGRNPNGKMDTTGIFCVEGEKGAPV